MHEQYDAVCGRLRQERCGRFREREVVEQREMDYSTTRMK